MIETVTSSQNRTIKLAASLHQKKYRDETGLFLLEGIRLAEDAVKSGWPIETCLFTAQTSEKERVIPILHELALRKTKMIEVSDEVFRKISDTEQPQGIILIAQKKAASLAEVFAGQTVPFIVVLESVQDPGNVGSLIRTADAAGCSGVILTKGCADPYAGKTVRAAMGSLFHLPVVSGADSSGIIIEFRRRQVAILATSLATRNLYHEVNMDRPVAIVFGNEGSGIREEILQAADELMYIPIYGQAESLNVSASAAVILYEAMRQRKQSGNL